MPGGRPRKSTEGVDEKTLKAREKATNYAEKKRLELEALQLEIIDCRDDLERMRRQQREIKKDLKMYEKKSMMPFIMEELDLPMPKPVRKSKPKPAMSAITDIEPPPVPPKKRLKDLQSLPKKIS
jgi:hypothetical protein